MGSPNTNAILFSRPYGYIGQAAGLCPFFTRKKNDISKSLAHLFCSGGAFLTNWPVVVELKIVLKENCRKLCDKYIVSKQI